MPRRPRAHQLEDESITAFRAALPKEWVFRELKPDYGIDGEVEIFAPSGVATGRKFYVQLKATDQVLARALSVPLKQDTCGYFQTLDLPVLLVRYHAPTGRLYARWFHRWRAFPLEAKSRIRSKPTKQAIFRFAEEDRWSETTADTLARDLDTIRRLRSPGLSSPVPLVLRFEASEVAGVPAQQVEISLRRLAASHPRIIQVNPVQPRDWAVTLTFQEDHLHIDIGGLSYLTFVFPVELPSEEIVELLPVDLMIAVAGLFVQLGHLTIAADLTQAFAPRSTVIEDMVFSFPLASAMVRAGRVTEALHLARTMEERPNGDVAAEMFHVFVFKRLDRLEPEHLDAYVRYLKDAIQHNVSGGHLTRAATLSNTLGLVYRHLRQYRLAVRTFRTSARLDPRYLKRPHYYQQLGGAFFLTKKHAAAAKMYGCAVERSNDPHWRVLYGDALLYSGRLKDAEAEFERYTAVEGWPLYESAEWRLKEWVTRGLRAFTGADEVIRQGRAAIQKLPLELPSPAAAGELEQIVDDALALDPLCAPAWFLAGWLASLTSDERQACFGFAAASVLEPEVNRWCYAILSALFVKDLDLAVLLVTAGYHHHKELLFERFHAIAHEQGEGFPASEIVSLVFSILQGIDIPHEPFTFRIYGEGEALPDAVIKDSSEW